jgi:glycosyltransferase involved in cell wall biosynthesis
LAKETVKKKSLRVALIASDRTVTENRLFLGRLLVGLSDESIPVALVCPENSQLDSIVLGSAEVMRYSSLHLPLMTHLNKKLLVARLEKFKPHVLHCLCETKAFLTTQFARQLDLPYMLMIHSLHKRWNKLSISLKRCIKIITPSQSITANVTDLYPHYADLIRQINIGTFITNTGGCFSDPFRIPTFVVAHPFHHAREFEKVFGALRHLHIEGHEFMVVVIGGGRAETQLWKFLAATGLLPIVTIVPRQTPWRVIFGTADIFIRPQPTKAFDPVLLEAMGVGLAVAGCRGGVDDLIIEDNTAAVFNPDDELSVFGTLQQLLSRHEFAQKIAKNAQEHLKKNHSVSTMISAYLELYSEFQK